MHWLESTWLQFALCAVLVGFAGAQLSIAGDAIARRTGLSGSWIGLALLATVTSLPELATGITSVTIANAPNLALGDALGSCVINLVFLVFIDLFFRRGAVWQLAGKGHVLAAAFGILMLGLTLTTLQMGQLKASTENPLAAALTEAGFMLATPLLLVLYLVAMRTVFAFESAQPSESGQPSEPRDRDASSAITKFALAALVVIAAGCWLPFVSSQLARDMGWNNSFVGTLFVAMVTSAPELAITMKIGRAHV